MYAYHVVTIYAHKGDFSNPCINSQGLFTDDRAARQSAASLKEMAENDDGMQCRREIRGRSYHMVDAGDGGDEMIIEVVNTRVVVALSDA